ncbi:MAG: DUF3667 domain-containing protein [Bacteroidales bacterium]|nr:DUF3667 domain-containing protein [Bacteroidales bacterium]
MSKQHSLAARWRAFTIWQELGFLPWKQPKEETKKRDGSFYKGAIPFLNDDAKRTFVELLLRPGYMIRDYIRGAHDKYLAPLTALIIFYSVFALLSALLQPYQKGNDRIMDSFEKVEKEVEEDVSVKTGTARDSFSKDFVTNTVSIMKVGYEYLTLDKHPENVDSRHKQALSALESTLRSQGIPLFIGKFILLWLAMSIALRRNGMNMSACATTAAYVLCQYSFLMLFALILSLGQSNSVSASVLLVVMAVDLRQMLEMPLKQSIKKAISISIWYGLMFCVIVLLVSALVLTTAYFKAV